MAPLDGAAAAERHAVFSRVKQVFLSPNTWRRFQSCPWLQPIRRSQRACATIAQASSKPGSGPQAASPNAKSQVKRIPAVYQRSSVRSQAV